MVDEWSAAQLSPVAELWVSGKAEAGLMASI
jgi:hypothetical protein